MEENMDEFLLKGSKSRIEQMYKEWCLTHPELVGPLNDPGKNHKMTSEVFMRDFQENSPDLFKTFLNKCFNVPKSDEASKHFREEGNQWYLKKQLKEAIESYNKAIRFAEDKSILALAFANRSAVLFQLGEAKACLRDVNRALETGYPLDLIHKLYERKGKCFLKLKAYSNALDEFEKALEVARRNIRDELKLVQFVKEVEKLKSNIIPSKSHDKTNFNENDQAHKTLHGQNPQMPSFSKAVKVVHSKSKGRHGVATRKIECGEVIMVEECDFNFPSNAFRGKVCTHCLKSEPDLIPSHLNTKDMFCSQLCLKKALETYHPKESQLIEALLEIGQCEWHIALRLVLAHPMASLMEHLSSHDPTYGAHLKPEQIYSSNDLKSVFNLQSSQEMWSAHRLHYKAFVAFFYLNCLKKVGYCSEEQEAFTGISQVLVHLMNVASLNAHEFGKFDDNNNANLMEGSVYPVGGSLSPSMVLLGHSCDPNTIRYQNGKNSILMANRTIYEGQEVAITYAETYAENDYTSRQKYLSDKYFFECKCIACSKQWPTKESMPGSFNDLTDGQLKIDLTSADPSTSIMQQMLAVQKLGSCISLEQKAGNYKKAMAYCIQFIQMLEKTIERPHAFYLMAEKTLFKLAWILN